MPNVKRPNMCESSYRNEVQMWYEKSQISICWMMRHHFFILAALILKKLQSLASKPKWPKVFVIVQIGTPLYLNVAQTICVISWGCVKGAWYEGKKNICLKMFFWQECQKCLEICLSAGRVTRKVFEIPDQSRNVDLNNLRKLWNNPLLVIWMARNCVNEREAQSVLWICISDVLYFESQGNEWKLVDEPFSHTF